LVPDDILATPSVEFLPEATTLTIECTSEEIDRSIRRAHPDVVLCLIKPQGRGRGW